MSKAEMMAKFEAMARRATNEVLNLPQIQARKKEALVEKARDRICAAATAYTNPFHSISTLPTEVVDGLTDEQLEKQIYIAIYGLASRPGFR